MSLNDTRRTSTVRHVFVPGFRLRLSEFGDKTERERPPGLYLSFLFLSYNRFLEQF